MKVIYATSVESAWNQAKEALNTCHVIRPSRYGEVWEYPIPVTTTYLTPLNRVLFNSKRNANPYFHFFEALWTLRGRNDTAYLLQFNSRVNDFSDDGYTWHDAYGYRWRNYFDITGGGESRFGDQIERGIQMLKRSGDERRAVLQMWDPVNDLERPDLKAVPCNTNVYFKIRPYESDGSLRLTTTVCCRSNDVVWGCYGSNQVVFSVLHEYMAAMIGVKPGEYYQISDSFHAYSNVWGQYGGLDSEWAPDLYLKTDTNPNPVEPFPMVADADTWDDELRWWMDENGDYWSDPHRLYSVEDVPSEPDIPVCYRNGFFPLVAQPLYNSWKAYKRNDFGSARAWLDGCMATDWQLAAQQWLQRAEAKRIKKAAKA